MDLPPPANGFSSDNASGALPEVIAAIAEANEGSATAYGADDWTAQLRGSFSELFGTEVEVALCYGGTGANLVALGSVTRPWQAVICPANAHINTDECGAPEALLGVKLLDVATVEGKLRPAQIEELLAGRGDEHHVQPRVVSITQSTEWGTTYLADEIGEICEVAHRNDLLVHVDGARLANAVAAAGGLRTMITDTGVDLLTFGGTKAGMLYGEAVVFLKPSLAQHVPFVRKQLAQLPSKMRFISAQFLALLDDERWITCASHANAMARRLADGAAQIPGVELCRRPEVNAVFVRLPEPARTILQDWSFFWDWDRSIGEVRWMTSHATTTEDIDRFLAGVRHAMVSEPRSMA